MLDLTQEDATLVKLAYDDTTETISIEEIPQAKVGVNMTLAKKGSDYMVFEDIVEADLTADWFTVSNFTFREIDRIEQSFWKKITGVDESGNPVYANTDTSDRVTTLFGTQYNALVSAI